MITLFTFPEAFGLRNVSPFCLKVEMALCYLDIDFEIALESDPRKGPKDKLPFIISDGVTLDDSELILQHLDEISDGGLYGALSPSEVGVGTAFARLADDHLYWMVVASRWLDDDWFPNVKQGFFSNMPLLISPLVSLWLVEKCAKPVCFRGLADTRKSNKFGLLAETYSQSQM